MAPHSPPRRHGEFLRVLTWLMSQCGVDHLRLARATGVDATVARRWVDGLSEPRLAYFEAICNAFNATPSQMLGWDSFDETIKFCDPTE